MKIALFSPLAPDRTEIASHTARLRGELAARHEVRFFSEQPDGFLEPATGRRFPAPLGSIPTELIILLNSEVDVPVYNLGNHPRFFSRTWFLSQAKPGIVVLHDLKLHHFFEGIYREQLNDQAAYLAWITEYYHDLGREAGLAYWEGKLSIEFMAEHFPMMAWAIRNALGIIVHTPHALETLERLTSTPMRLVPLPYEPTAREGEERSEGGRAGFSPANPAQFIIFGYLNANRRVVEFLQALAVMPEKGCFRIHIFGTVEHRARVEAAVAAAGLSEQVIFHGYVPDEALDAGLAGADLAINLRYPTMGEASASQLRIWDHTLPSLVTQTEAYAALPPDAVFFVRPDHEQADIQEHLRRFLSHPEEFWRSGQRGRQWLRENHSPTAYVDCLTALCEEAHDLRRRLNQLRAADRIGKAVAPWLDLTSTTAREKFYAAVIVESM